MATPARLWFCAFSAIALTGSVVVAQDAPMPTFTGKGSITQAIDGEQGAIFDIGSGITMTFPKGLPVGRSRLVTLKKASKKPSAAQIQKGFTPIGTAIDFSTPIAAKDAPIVVAMAHKGDPKKKASQRLVLAMEVGTLCNAQNKSTKQKNGLCSGWELIDAEYDAGGQRLVAKLQSTGGMRMVFGVVEGDH